MNSRLDEIQAAFLRVLLPALPALNAARQQVAAQYSAVLGALPGGALPPRPTEAVDVAHLFVLRHARRDALRAALLARAFRPTSTTRCPTTFSRVSSPGWRLGEPPMAPAGALPVSEAACAEVFSLPCHPSLDAGQVQRVCDALREPGDGSCAPMFSLVIPVYRNLGSLARAVAAGGSWPNVCPGRWSW
jgi:dTDP-4-amino-4,6-dideoxygalactose transaminase